MDNIVEVLQEAASIMVLGMTMVFIFLTLLVFVVKTMSKLVGPAPVEPQTSPTNSQKITKAPSADNVDPNVVAAISVAVHKYRTAASQ
ncbi:oxaloacetate decarboxylase gamma chain [Vibrio ishigakensis]|uniref:Probable oxaloacetate decarboxylase gamma chain n=1 Tax=Vibrio ishigakensis TaxID=1481914 RepID=A0A0B8PFQ7_9VIBR|nr:oxaloacetate decarboxylase subunit gamma [Vibrio ishigakensis]GAM55191.1 oxaloacetate decarboxylase gamma chain [Vibrio ishigakensis]GAM61694.1 oxaloacetate decarboxylase gamma chain [Vibrio ishigakensis]GAM67307.1 oxaloacetate decarboxylase gamma chain [Vibrio sp. JCM 19236]GAM72746.1 oxaloacetate decarboxylase gamma chain [Vibrio ishigakensis]